MSRLPKDVTDILDSKIYPTLRERLLKLGLVAEARTFNLQHVTVVHIHSADPSTPQKMLSALPKVPRVLKLTLKNFYNTEAAAGAGAPWWFDLGVVKTGQGFTEMMSYNTVATAALTPLRDGPLPRVTGPVYAKMGDAGKERVRTVGVSGVNVMKDGKETASHNPHNTLVYSMTPYDAADPGGDEGSRRRDEQNPSGRYRYAVQGHIDRRDRVHGQRAARVLPDKSRGRQCVGRRERTDGQGRCEVGAKQLRQARGGASDGADPVQERQPARSSHRCAAGRILGARRRRHDPRGLREARSRRQRPTSSTARAAR